MKLGKAESARGKVAPAGSGGRARMLVTVTVLGSAGPLRFLIDEGETVAGLIRAALRCYAREGRMPLLGADAAGFLLYTANGGSDGTPPPTPDRFNPSSLLVCSVLEPRLSVSRRGVQRSAPTRRSTSTAAGASCSGRRRRATPWPRAAGLSWRMSRPAIPARNGAAAAGRAA